MSKKSRVPNIYKYGIELTKPFSKEMYNHNDKVVTIMKGEIQAAIDHAYDVAVGLKEDNSLLHKLTKFVCWCSHANEEPDYLKEELENDLGDLAPYQLDQDYLEMVKEGFVSDIGVGLVGFEDKEEILELRKNSANINTMTVSFDNKNK